MRYSLSFSFIFLLSAIFIKSCQQPANQLNIFDSLAQSIVFLDSTIESGTLKQLVFADSLFHKHHLTDALSAYSSIKSNRSTTIDSYIEFRTNEIKQKLNTHLVYPDSILSHTNIKINSNSISLDSILYFLDEINLYNPIDITAFESLADRILENIPVPKYWQAKINLILGEYYFYEVNDIYKAYSYYNKANVIFISLEYPTHEILYLKKDIIQLTIGQREYLVGRNHGDDMIRISQTYFPSDTVLCVISNYMSGYIDRIALPDNTYLLKYKKAAEHSFPIQYSKLHQTVLSSFIYSVRSRNDTILLDSLRAELKWSISKSDTFVNYYKMLAEEYYKQKAYANTVLFAQKAIYFQNRYKRYAPPIYLTLSSVLIESYRQLGQLENSNREAFNNINFKYPFKSYNYRDILDGNADYGYFNFIIIGDLIKNLYLSYLQNKNLQNLLDADQLVDKANELIDKENYSIEENRRVDMLGYSKAIYNTAMQVYYELYSQKRGNTYLERFFYYQEKTKANILYGESVELREKYKIPEELTKYELNLKDELRKYRMNVSEISYVDKLYKKFDSLNLIYQVKYPNFYSTRVSGGIKSFSNINIADTILFASYSIFDSTVYTFYIGDSVWITKSEYDYLLDRILDSTLSMQMRNEITNPTYANLSSSLSSEIIDTLNLKNEKVLIFCPGGKLNGLNISLLHSGINESKLEDGINVFYTFSASSMDPDGINLNVTGKTVAFSFSDKETIKNPSMILPELPGAYQEVLEIGNQFTQIKIYSGKKATKQNCILSYTDRSVIHLYFALHGVASSETRENTYLLFRTSNFKKLDTLYGFELLRYSSSPMLITLAACESSNGIMVESEGIYNLVRYFKLNGAKLIKANYFKLHDNASISWIQFI